MEQPKDNVGSNENFGKFKDVESLMKAYSNLEAEFTKKSQRLSQLENENKIREKEVSRRAEIDKRVDEFVKKFDVAIPFSSALKESLASDENLSLSEETIKLITNNYKRAEDYITDDEFLNKYVYKNEKIRDKIVKDYLSQIPQNSPIKVETSGGILMSKPSVPTTIEEAGRIAKSIIKNK